MHIMSQINCLLVTGIRLNDDIRTVLYLLGIGLYRNKKHAVSFSFEEYMLEGNVTCTYRAGALGYVSGIMFEATVDFDSVSGFVRYIIPRGYLEGDMHGFSFGVYVDEDTTSVMN